MDRLEEIKALRSNAGFYANLTVHKKATEQVDWLISEIERLKKEKEWLIGQCVELEITLYDYGMDKPYLNAKEGIIQHMQQALKEVEDNVGRNIN